MIHNKQPASAARFPACEPDEHGRCITCSDEALQAHVLSVDHGLGLAIVALEETTAEVDISLVDQVEPDDIVLVHGGVVLEKLS